MNPAPHPSPDIAAIAAGRHVTVLDGLRGFAVLYVLLYHFMPSFPGVTGFVVNAFFKMGWTGVDLFFVLSGFLITGVLYGSRGSPHPFRRFYIRRILRIFPAYYLLILFSVLIVPALTGYAPVQKQSCYWFFVSNFDTELSLPFHPYLCVAWSLSIEEQYYVFYPTISYFLSYRRWCGFLLGVLVLSFCLRWIAYLAGGFSPIRIYHFTLTHFDGIALGGLIRMLMMKFDENRRLLEAFIACSWVSCPAMASLGLYCYYEMAFNHRDPHLSFHPAMFLFGYLLAAVVYAQLLLRCVVGRGVLHAIFSTRVLRSVGKFSYAMYLWQFPGRDFADTLIGRLDVARFVDLQLLPGRLLICLFRLCVVYLFGFLSWHLLEYPVSRLKERLTGARRPTPVRGEQAAGT